MKITSFSHFFSLFLSVSFFFLTKPETLLGSDTRLESRRSKLFSSVQFSGFSCIHKAVHPSLLSSFRTFLSPHKKTGTHQSSHSFLLPFPQSWQSSVRFLHHISFVLGLLLILFLLSPPQSSETSQTGEPPGPSESLARVVMYGCAGCSPHNSVWLSWSLGSFDGAEAESGVSRSWRRGARGGEPDLEGCMARPHPPQPPAHPQVQSLPYKRSGIPAGIECGVGIQR